ncbi:MAG: DUF2017 domain-containing protein [Nocardioidaceae bacterium]
MKRFKSRRRGGAYAVLEQNEARLVANLAAQVVELLGDESSTAEVPDPLEVLADIGAGPQQPPDDPVLQRLLPDAYRDDDESAAEFRRFTERGLRGAKVTNARTVIESLVVGGMQDVTPEPGDDGPVEVDLDAAQVQSWLRTLTDIRLALATRLGIEDDEHDWSHDRDDPAAGMHDIYDWLGFVQETLLAAIDR